MSTISIEDVHLKELLKQAILELMQERKEEFEEIFAEILEDFAIARAIKEGESTEIVSKTEVLQVLGSKD